MDECIKREAVIEAIMSEPPDAHYPQWYVDKIKSIPAVDVALVRHGRWEKQSGLYSCSECGLTCPYDVQADVIEYWACNYCPNCGAKIDKEEE